jgi:tRNA C32,U32 (ribose-2'-O)-methylase TrmJ
MSKERVKLCVFNGRICRGARKGEKCKGLAQHAAPLQGSAASRDGASQPAASAPLAPWEVDWCEPVALLVGNEGAGLPEEVERSADARIRIPMASGVESLNAAAAAAVLFYEAARQRSKQRKDSNL